MLDYIYKMRNIHSSYQIPIKLSIRTVLFFATIFFISLLSADFYEIKGLANYLPLHTLFEFLSIIISAMIFGTAWVRIADNKNIRNYIILACSFLAVAILDFFHVLSFPGMPVIITPSGSEKTINFWLMARYFSALSLLLISLLSWNIIATRAMHWRIFSTVFSLTCMLVIIGFYFPTLIPSTYIEGEGLTKFKIMSEYSIAGLYLAVGMRLLYVMRTPQPYGVVNLFTAVCLMAMSEILFTLYSDLTDIFNFLGHSYKIIAYAFIYKSIFITSIVKPYDELSKSKKLLNTIIEAIPMSVFWKDRNLRYLGCNTQFAKDAGLNSPAEIIDKSDDELPWSNLAPSYQLDDKLVMDTGKAKLNYEESQFTPTGEPIIIRTSKSPIPDEYNGVIGMVGIYDDITNWSRSQEKIKLAASVFVNARENIIITDTTGIMIDVNDSFTKTTGYSYDEAIGQNPHILKSGRHSPEFYADMWQALIKDGHWYGELWNRRKNGEVYAEMKTITAVNDKDGVTTHYVSLGSDITPMKNYQIQIEHIAHYDVLTDLPNRALLADRLSQAMLQCKRHSQSLAVVFLDLDGFKSVNDTHGHDIGDDLLIALSGLMKEALRDGDSLARIGGDEFVAVLTDLSSVEDYEPVLERLLLAASKPIKIGNLVISVSASIGVTLYPQDNVDTDQLMRHADQAMYLAKDSGKNCYHLFDTAQDDAVKVQRESLEAIRTALDNHQFVLYYQPKVNMRTGTVVGAEALIRWQHPIRGLLNPIDFLPVIENNPMMIEIGEWVIDTALTQINQLHAMGLRLPISTSVNIAAVQLQQSDFTKKLTELLAAHPEVDPRYLELEILETSVLEDVHHVSKTMNDCMALGVSFALDDFGTGYSSLTHLRRLPANLIKIDQTFVRDMLENADDLAIVEGVIALAKSFKREVIAEGVETIEHGSALLKLGCELAQGYGIARPMPASDIPAWVDNWKPDANWRS
jgi:diguanylate cyclase (GGDEF)-like protein/PAS domain S-box-containing protein